ncbi:hypothetical protein SEUCBS139899_003855 [Sporothrix eucalyptigena]|uniref:Rhodopsin domain-containing protein n=1 Tax=Sporothrix eucalyptigena TaxID=1812306 RepID=A0ABP0D1M1_9PEZI
MVTANGYESRAGTVVAANVILITIMSIFVLIRFWARAILLRQVGLDDVLIWISFILSLAPCICAILMTKHGLGYHMTDVSDAEYDKFSLLLFISSITYVSAFVLAKLSFAVFYLRVIPTRGFRRLNYVIIGLLIAQGIEETFVVIFSCTPVYKYWTVAAEGKCLNLLNFYYISFGVKLLSDLILFLEPIPTLKNLKLPWAKRVGLMVMFSLGLLACVISIIRCTYLNDTSTDVTWRLVDPSNWSSAELCSLVICACIPYVRNLLAEIPHVNAALGLSSGNSKGGYSGGYGNGLSGGYGRNTGAGGNSIALQSRTPYIQQQTRIAGDGSASAAVTAGGKNGISSHTLRGTESTEEIFPNYRDKSGGIVVSTDVKVAVERHTSQDSFSGSS